MNPVPYKNSLRLDSADTFRLNLSLKEYENHLREKFFDIPRENTYGKTECEDAIHALNFLRVMIDKKSYHTNKLSYELLLSKDIDKPFDVPNQKILNIPQQFLGYILAAYEYKIKNLQFSYFFTDEDSAAGEEKRKVLSPQIRHLMKIRLAIAATKGLESVYINQKETKLNSH